MMPVDGDLSQSNVAIEGGTRASVGSPISIAGEEGESGKQRQGQPERHQGVRCAESTCIGEANEDGTRTVEVKLTLTAPGCGMGDVLVDDVKDKIQRIPTVREARVELTFDPPWNQSMMSEAARLQTGMY